MHGVSHSFKALQETLTVLAWLSYNFKKSLEHSSRIWGTQMYLLVRLMVLVILPNLQGHGFITPWISVWLKKNYVFPYFYLFFQCRVNVKYNAYMIYETEWPAHSHTKVFSSFLWLNRSVIPCRLSKSWTQRGYEAGSKWHIHPAALLSGWLQVCHVFLQMPNNGSWIHKNV